MVASAIGVANSRVLGRTGLYRNQLAAALRSLKLKDPANPLIGSITKLISFVDSNAIKIKQEKETKQMYYRMLELEQGRLKRKAKEDRGPDRASENPQWWSNQRAGADASQPGASGQ